MIWHVQQNVVKCLIIPLPRLSYIYWFIQFKGQSTDIEKTVFRKVLLIWQRIYKQISSTFYTSNDVSRRKSFSTSYQSCEIAVK